MLLEKATKFAQDEGAGRITTFLSTEASQEKLRKIYTKAGFSTGDTKHAIEAWGGSKTLESWSKTLDDNHPVEAELAFDSKDPLWSIGPLSKSPYDDTASTS